MSGEATVLVVDDDKDIRDLIGAALAGQGYRPVFAGNGKEALAYLRSPAPRPGLILLDLMMPEMSGWEFRKLQQQDPGLAAIPVAIITGVPGERGGPEAVGVVDVLYKPSHVEALMTLVARLCSHKAN